MRLPSALADQIIEHARAEFPNECCGLIAGSGDLATRVLPTTNAEGTPFMYVMDPREQMELMDAIEDAGEDLVAIYHSHPTSDPVPSLVDRDWHWADDVVDLIIGLAGSTPQYRAWLLNPWPAREVLVEEWSGFRGDVGQASHFQADLKIRDAGEDQIDAHKRADYPQA